MGFYDNGLRTQHENAAQALASSGTRLTVNGPAGRVGRVLDVSYNITTNVTVTGSTTTIGPSGDADAQGAYTVPVGSVVGGRVAHTQGPAETAGSLASGVDIAADAITLLITGGEAATGAADILMLVNWW